MATQETSILGSLTEGLKLKDLALATLVDSVNLQETPYDFFRILATHIIPYIQKNSSLQTLVKRWERKGNRKGSLQLTPKRFIFNGLSLSTQMTFKTQLDTLKSNSYNPKGISLPDE